MAYRPTYRDEHAIVSHFINLLEERLAGREADRRANVHPLDWCLLGALGPQKASSAPVEPTPEQPDVDPTSGTNPAVKIAEQREAPRGVSDAAGDSASEPAVQAAPRERPDIQRGNRRPPSALGFEMLVKPNLDGYVCLRVAAHFCVFTKHLPTRQEQASLLEIGIPEGAPLAEVVQRWPIEVQALLFRFKPDSVNVLVDDGRVQAAIDKAMENAFARADADRQWPQRPKLLNPDSLHDEATFLAYLNSIVGTFDKQKWEIKGSVEVRATVRPDGLVRIGCYVRNNTPETPPGTRNKGGLDAFLTISDARMDAELLEGEIFPVEILPVPQDYQYDRRVWGIGHNTSVHVRRDIKAISTHPLACYEQLRIVTHNDPPARFADLAEDPISVLVSIESAMRKYLTDWRERILDQNVLKLDTKALVECGRDCDGFADEIRRFGSGIAALLSDKRLLTAFKGANRVFGRVAKGYEAWRLFQIVFFVTQLPALVIREGVTNGVHPDGTKSDWSDCLDWGDVLWFRTGGGKTEAYLGLACCAMLYDRLRGKLFGVTAWLRLPLRMLSIQQLQRAMRVVWETESERKALLGTQAKQSDSIRLGYFVGGQVTPNALGDDVFQRFSTVEARERLRVIPDCPACGANGSVDVTVDDKQRRFLHICRKCSSELPLDISDDEVYRYLPGLVVGTVDKMASVGQQQKFGMLWGGAQWRCPKHGYALGKYCSVYGCKVKPKEGSAVSPYDPSPALHIQDELHLLQEELGAFAGHYETLIRFCEKTISNRPSKVIAATATIEGFERQVQHLYGTKNARRFPGRGYDKHANFYAGPDLDSREGSEKTARFFVAFKSASLSPADASARVTEILQTEATHLMQNPHLALAILKDARTEEDIKELLRYYTTTLNYVGSLARGSRVSQALEDSKARVRPGAARELNVEYTSSRTTGAEVASIVHRIENPPAWNDPGFLDALVATNMISHGVDLERINIMIMDGVPDETAEYIQASSRSGRRHVGMVVVVLAEYSLRAASIYHRFLEYHAHLDRMVSPVPVNRFAKYAADRTLPGVTMGLIYGLHAARSHSVTLNRRHDVVSLLDRLGNEFGEQIRSAYALNEGIYDPRLEQGLTESLNEGIDRMRMHLRGSHETYAKDALRPSPMTSLRDVEAGVPFWPEGDASLLVYIERTRE
jgi:hypothetical protein